MRYLALLSLLVAACSSGKQPPNIDGMTIEQPATSSSIALTSDDSALWVVNPEADSVSVIDPRTRTLSAEILLAPQRPTVDAATQRYEPGVRPRALAIVGDKKVYVAGQTSGRVYVIDAASRAVTGSIPVGAAPVAVVASPDGAAVYVVSLEAAQVAKIDPATDQVVATLPVGEHPFGAGVRANSSLLYVTHFLLDPGVTTIDTKSFTVKGSTLALPDAPPDVANGKRAPNGKPRGLYAAVPRPSLSPVGGEVWVPHLLLAVGTPEPDLDFESTVFPAVSRVSADGTSLIGRLDFSPLDPPGIDGAFTDVISGPRAVAFTPDGKLALLANGQSEDVMVFDGESGHEVALVRPLPSTYLEGIVVDHAGKRAYVDGRSSHDVTVLRIDASDPIEPVSVDGGPIERLESGDPMPANLRQGQRLFFSANSAAFPITRNFWVACSSCHLEGGTDAVTWRFFVGPRDTPSNAGGPINTGFLLRQALRNDIIDYDTTINIEQGGSYHRADVELLPQLKALRDFVNYAIPLPQNPNRAPDGKLTDAQARGQSTFTQLCASCHQGAYFTDSGAGNPTLDLSGAIVLHDIGTCVKPDPQHPELFIDQPAPDEVVGKMHTACDFDTPTLRGIFASAPYFHDGSARTLADVVARLPFTSGLSPSAKDDLVAYLLTL